MTTYTARTLRAFLIAPLVPPLLYWALGPVPALAALPGFMAYGGACGYLAILLLGVPAYNLIISYSCLRASHVFAISGILGAGTLSLMSPVIGVLTLLLGVLLGLSAGIAFWLAWRKNAAQPAVAPGGVCAPPLNGTVGRRITMIRLGLRIIAVVALALIALEVGSAAVRRDSAERRLRQLDLSAERLRAAPSDARAFQELSSATESKDAWTRSKAFAAMTAVGSYPGVPPAALDNIRDILVPAVRRGLRDAEGVVRREAANAASAFGGAASPLKADLIEALQAYHNADVGWFSATALGNLGPSARDALPTLRATLRKESWGHQFVEEAIEKIEGTAHDGAPPREPQ